MISRETVYGIFSDRLMGTLALLFVPLTLLDLTAPASLEPPLFLVDWAVISVFIIEYLLKLAVAESKRGFVVEKPHIFDLAVILMPFLGLFPTALEGSILLSSSPLLRLLRVVRMAVFTGRAVGALDLHRVLARNRFYHVLGVALAVYFATSYLFYLVESNNPRVGSYFDALWWGLGYLTTVGSEIAPQTLAGRLLGVALMATGISFVGILTANIVNFFMEMQKRSRPQSRKGVEERLEELTAIVRELRSRIGMPVDKASGQK